MHNAYVSIFQPEMISSEHPFRCTLCYILQCIATFVEQRNRDARASYTRRLAEHIDRSFMRFHGGLLCATIPGIGDHLLPLSASLSLSLSLPLISLRLSFSVSWSATSTYFRIARNWHAATAAAPAGRSTKPSRLTSAAVMSITSCVFHVVGTKIHSIARFRGRSRTFLHICTTTKMSTSTMPTELPSSTSQWS